MNANIPQDILLARKKWAYYKEAYAKSIQSIPDGMLADNKAREIKAEQAGMSIGSIEKFLSQASMYLIDHLDTPERKYFKWRRAVTFSKDVAGNRVVISFKGGALTAERQSRTYSAGVGIAGAVTVTENTKITKHKPLTLDEPGGWGPVGTDWQQPFEDFVVNDGDAVLDITDCRLGPEDIQYIKATCSMLTGLTILLLNEKQVKIKRGA